jgi:type I restriction enzyme S subunit
MEKEKQLVPELRFPKYNGNWAIKKIQKLIDNNSIIGHLDGNHGELYPKNTEFTSKGIPYLSANDFLNGFVNLESCKFLPLKRANSFKKGIAINGDVLFAHNATVGPTAILRTKLDYVILSTTATYFRCDNKKLINTYLRYYIESFQFVSQYRRIMGQSTRNQVPITAQRKLNISLPKFDEQKKIANFISSTDVQIQTLEKKKSLLEDYKKGLTQKILKQEIRFKDKNGNKFPDWNHKKLGNLTYKVGKKNKESIQYPIYSINNQEGFRPQSEQFAGLDSNDRGYDISLYKIVEKETFAYNPARINVGSIGYSYDLNEVIISSLYVCFKTNEELEDLYLLAYLDTDRFNKDILRYQEGGVRQYLFYENFSQIKIPLPSNLEQLKIANFLSAIDKNIAIVNQKIEHTKTYKKGLLQQMFV